TARCTAARWTPACTCGTCNGARAAPPISASATSPWCGEGWSLRKVGGLALAGLDLFDLWRGSETHAIGSVPYHPAAFNGLIGTGSYHAPGKRHRAGTPAQFMHIEACTALVGDVYPVAISFQLDEDFQRAFLVHEDVLHQDGVEVDPGVAVLQLPHTIVLEQD